ncbi:MAG: cation transporter [Granulosicoccus sp.]|nr:cation transporter [Granulosicoccus sp.]
MRKIALRTVLAGVVLNIGLAVIKGTAGTLGHSYALIADAIESATDACASLLLLFGLRFALQPADDNHPYGHGRAEALLTFVIVVLLVTAAAVIAVESIDRIRTPHRSPEPWTLLVLAAVIAVKELAFRHVSHQGESTRSTTLKADAWHHRSDAITSLAAFIGISIALWMGDGWETADDWAALVAAAVIVLNAYLIFRPALGELMDEQFHEDLVQDIREIATRHSSVIDTEKCFVRKAGVAHHVDLHLIVDGALSVRRGHEIAHQVKTELMMTLPEVSDVLIHVEPSD